ncbi:cyclin-domain-containing protein [Syncephalis fuscata]|nr:cyclin-domain-containing protein [Syncephalis fuscata]
MSTETVATNIDTKLSMPSLKEMDAVEHQPIIELPADFGEANPSDVARIIASYSFPLTCNAGISITDYLARIVRYTSLETACLLCILVYIDRVCASHPTFTLASLTAHRFISAAVTVSAKALCDIYCTNAHYAKVGGVSCAELNALELALLRMIDWRLYCRREELQRYYENLVRQHPGYRLAEKTTPLIPLTNFSNYNPAIGELGVNIAMKTENVIDVEHSPATAATDTDTDTTVSSVSSPATDVVN